jgi:hypothetical protein
MRKHGILKLLFHTLTIEQLAGEQYQEISFPRNRYGSLFSKAWKQGEIPRL